MTQSHDQQISHPPKANKIPHKLEKHGDVRVDDYYWLRNKDNPDVLDYLKAENDHAEKAMGQSKELEEALFQEIKGRIKPADLSVPFQMGDHFYYVRYEPDREYGIYCRKRHTLESAEEIMLDGNVTTDKLVWLYYDQEEPRLETIATHGTEWGSVPAQYSHPHPQADPTGKWIVYNVAQGGRTDL